MWTLKCFLKNAWKMFYDLKWTNWINAGEPDGRFAMSTPHYWLKNLPQQPFKVVTSVDAGKWFDEMKWHDFLRDYLCWIMCFPAQPFFFWELKRHGDEKTSSTYQKQSSCLHLMFKYCDILDNWEPSQTNCVYLKPPSPLMVFHQTSRTIPVG